jgi:hypothetical protein
MGFLNRLSIILGLLALPLSVQAADVAVLNNGFSIRHERRDTVGQVTRLYVDAEGASYVDVPTEQIVRFDADLTPPTPVAEPQPVSANLPGLVAGISSNYHLDPDLVNSVIHAESGFNPHAVSPKGAQGLMQLMPQTATQLGIDDAFDPGANVDGGTRYLRQLLERYDFDLVKALAAYNAGPQRVEQYRGVPPYSETRAYVSRIVRDFNRKKLAERQAAKLAASRAHPARNPVGATASPYGTTTRLTRVASTSNDPLPH